MSVESTPVAPSGETGHEDTFCRDSLPPRELWPHMDYAAAGPTTRRA